MNDRRVLELSDDALEGVTGGFMSPQEKREERRRFEEEHKDLSPAELNRQFNEYLRALEAARDAERKKPLNDFYNNFNKYKM